MRTADVILQTSRQRMHTTALISNAQVKLWKALLLSIYFVGFIGAMMFAVGLQLGNPGQASGFGNGVNIAPLLKIVSSSFAREEEGEGWSRLIDGDMNPESTVVWNSHGSERPFVEFRIPGTEPQAVSGVLLSLDPSNPNYQSCGVKEFELLGSKDGKEYATIVAGVKSPAAGFEFFSSSNPVQAQFLKFLLKSNWGDPNVTCVKELRVLQEDPVRS